MDSEMIKIKLNSYYLSHDPFIELNNCFDPCVTDLSNKMTSDLERTCMGNCLSKYISVTQDLQISLPYLNKNMQGINQRKAMLEKQANEIED